MENIRGAILMMLAMLGFAIEDVFIKILANSISVAQILLTLGAGGCLFFWMMAKRQGATIISRDLLHPAIIMRNLGELIGTIGFVTALALTPLSSASAILQAAPLIVTMGAALFLGEAVGWRRWTAILVGFGGVLMILRPGTENFEAASFFAVQGTIGLAVRDVAIRRVPKHISSMQLSTYGFLMLIPASGILFVLGQPMVVPTSTEWGLLALSLGIGVVAYYLLVGATRRGDVSFVTPFRYSRLLFAIGFAYAIFGEIPDVWMIMGSLLVVGSGLFMFAREAKLRTTSNA
ncbi:MAG: DMT family transporter [Pseudomonadota bacterium]